MGPPEFTGGNSDMATQMGRDLYTLQWGRRNSPAETLRISVFDLMNIEASMGPPEFTGGNPSRTWRSLAKG